MLIILISSTGTPSCPATCSAASLSLGCPAHAAAGIDARITMAATSMARTSTRCRIDAHMVLTPVNETWNPTSLRTLRETPITRHAVTDFYQFDLGAGFLPR